MHMQKHATFLYTTKEWTKASEKNAYLSFVGVLIIVTYSTYLGNHENPFCVGAAQIRDFFIPPDIKGLSAAGSARKLHL